MAVTPAALKHPIVINGRDLANTGDLPRVCSVNAMVRGVKSIESVESGADQMFETLEFTIRWRDGLDTSMLVWWRGHGYEIERIDPTPYEWGYRRIWAHSLRGVGT